MVAANDALALAAFPLVFFFGGLFYTDVWSLIFVLAGWERVLAGRRWAGAINSAVSLLFRQTNVLWTAFLALVAVVDTLKPVENVEAQSRKPASSLSPGEVVQRAWTDGKVYDPALSEVDAPSWWILTGIPTSVLSLAAAALRSPQKAFQAVIPFAIVMGGFVVFIIWNGGIVLGKCPITIYTSLQWLIDGMI